MQEEQVLFHVCPKPGSPAGSPRKEPFDKLKHVPLRCESGVRLLR